MGAAVVAPGSRTLIATRRSPLVCARYENYGEVSVATKMASSVDEVNSLVEELRARCYPTAEAEFGDLQDYAVAQGHAGGELRHWDVAYWAERHKCVPSYVQSRTCHMRAV